MASFLDRMKDMVFVDETKNPVATATQVIAVPVTVSFTGPAVIGNGSVNPEILAILVAALDANKTVYTTFKETSDKIAGVIADEATRFKTAAATIGKCNAEGKAELLAAVEGYASVLAVQKTDAKTNLDATLGNEINTLTNHNAETDAKIADLNVQLSQLTEDKLRTEQRVSELSNQYAGFIKDFDATLAKVTSDLDVEHKKLEIYLGG